MNAAELENLKSSGDLTARPKREAFSLQVRFQPILQGLRLLRTVSACWVGPPAVEHLSEIIDDMERILSLLEYQEFSYATVEDLVVKMLIREEFMIAGIKGRDRLHQDFWWRRLPEYEQRPNTVRPEILHPPEGQVVQLCLRKVDNLECPFMQKRGKDDEYLLLRFGEKKDHETVGFEQDKKNTFRVDGVWRTMPALTNFALQGLWPLRGFIVAQVVDAVSQPEPCSLYDEETRAAAEAAAKQKAAAERKERVERLLASWQN